MNEREIRRIADTYGKMATPRDRLRSQRRPHGVLSSVAETVRFAKQLNMLPLAFREELSFEYAEDGVSAELQWFKATMRLVVHEEPHWIFPEDYDLNPLFHDFACTRLVAWAREGESDRVAGGVLFFDNGEVRLTGCFGEQHVDVLTEYDQVADELFEWMLKEFRPRVEREYKKRPGRADLRKSSFDLVVYGRLAAPEPDDDGIPSIEEFREATTSLANSLGLRSTKEILDEVDPPFDVRAHWRWMALADLGAAQTGTTPSKNDHEAFNGDIPFIKPADILPDGINYSNESLTRYGAESGSRLAPAGSLLMVCIGTIGKCNLIDRECAFNQQINSLSPVQWVDSQFLLLAVRAQYFQEAAWNKSSSTTLAILNKGKWISIPVPIPPLAEQRRIVAKVEQLMAIVNELEARLADSRAAGEKLLAALVAELTAGKETHSAAICRSRIKR